VHRTDDSADRVEDDLQIDEACRRPLRHDAQEHEHVGDRDGREDLQKILDPEVNDPEPPEVDHGEVRLRSEQHAHAVEDGDRE
jgi:hypothetical protein